MCGKTSVGVLSAVLGGLVVKSLRILIVDDNKEGCETLMLLLRAYKHTTEMCNDAIVAVQSTLKFKPDVVLLDIGMPNINGWDVCLAMRNHECLKSTKIYALTGYGEQGDIQRSMESGMNYHFVKPLDLDDFWSVLKMQNVICGQN